MDFVHYELGQRDGGDVVEVRLDTAANVRLLDIPNFTAYQGGQPHQFYGGYVTQSPFAIRVPHRGYWHLVIDLGGYPGQVRSTVRVLSPPG
jgi:hypothetical protein